jgi:glucosamine--fructose-6-phosphate aminotransferase (isomerizing)
MLLSDRGGIDEIGRYVWKSVEMPGVDPFVTRILYALPVQLLTCHAAVLWGTEVGRPRNLAKSVIVE